VNRLLQAYAAGVITSDGHYQKERDLASFYSKSKNEIEKAMSLFSQLGLRNMRVYLDRSRGKSKVSNHRYKLFLTQISFCRVLKGLGVPTGNKTNASFLIPDWIKSGEDCWKKSYLRGIFDGEGGIYSVKGKGSKRRWKISLGFAKREDLRLNLKEFLEEIKFLLSGFDIKSSPPRFRRENKRRDGSWSIYGQMDIERSQFENFYKHINFLNTEKRRKLKRVLVRYAGVSL
jgi:tRNA-splicing ligase RtcB